LRIQQHGWAVCGDALTFIGYKRRGLCFDKRLERSGPPVVVGYLIMCSRKRMDTTIDYFYELLDLFTAFVLGLTNKAAYHS
jgi:hypothetical protein